MAVYPHSLPDVHPDIGETPLATLMESEVMMPALAAREWVVEAARRQGRSHALLLTAGKGVATLRHGQLALRAPCLAWLPPGMAQSIRLEAGGAGYMLSAAEELVSRASPPASMPRPCATWPTACCTSGRTRWRPGGTCSVPCSKPSAMSCARRPRAPRGSPSPTCPSS